MIILFRGKKLVEQLGEGRVPETHKLIYLALPVVFEYLSDMFLPGSSYGLSGQAVPVKLLVYSVAIGVIFYINKRGDNRNFLERFICLSFPAGIIVNLIGFFYGVSSAFFLTRIFTPGALQVLTSLFFKLNGIFFYVLVAYWVSCIPKSKKLSSL